MTLALWSQDNFSKGELSPLLYARATVEAYYKGLKLARNVFSIPQGGCAKRFGTRFIVEPSNVTDASEVKMVKWNYEDEGSYIIIIRDLAIDIYLESDLVDTITTAIPGSEIDNIDVATVGNKLFIASRVQAPYVLEKTTPTSQTITAFAATTLTASATHAANTVEPFYLTGTVPTATPTLVTNVTYFARFTSTSEFKVYEKYEDAKNNASNNFAFSALGSATANFETVFLYGALRIDVPPNYDFGDQNINASTITCTAASGLGQTLTSSPGVFVAANANGVFIGDGGLAVVTAYVSATELTVDIVLPFSNLGTSGISGKYCKLTQAAWSSDRGYPEKVSAYQNRLVFANTRAIPNGVWLSASNDFYDFGNIDTLDGDAIAYFPNSSNVAYITHIVPYRSLTFHTNAGIYSTPLLQDTAVTPNNFSLTLQDSTPTTEGIPPVIIDNQIVFSAGNDVHTLIWDGYNNSYTNTLASVMSEHLIQNPRDMAGFLDAVNEGSRYVFVVNEDGTMAMYQSLISENVSGWTLCEFNQPYGEVYIRQVETNFEGRCWFLVERSVAAAGATGTLDGCNFADATLSCSTLSLTTGLTTAVLFTSGTLPETTPQIGLDTYYYIVPTNATTFQLFATPEDADNGVNPFIIGDPSLGTCGFGSSAVIELWPYTNTFYIEELDFNQKVDCALTYDSSATSTLTGAARFNAQPVQIQGDGSGFYATGYDDEIAIEAHGASVDISKAQAGYGIPVTITPMPISMSTGQSINTSNLAQPKHIRSVNLMFNSTIGGTVNGKPIDVNKFSEVSFGAPPKANNGIMSINPMAGWNDFVNPAFTIYHNDPFDFKFLGAFYKVEI